MDWGLLLAVLVPLTGGLITLGMKFPKTSELAFGCSIATVICVQACAHFYAKGVSDALSTAAKSNVAITKDASDGITQQLGAVAGYWALASWIGLLAIVVASLIVFLLRMESIERRSDPPGTYRH